MLSKTKPKLILCDIWGVVHNDKKLHEGLPDFLSYCKKNNILVVLFSNAPRRSSTVENFLLDTFNLKLGKDYHDIITSGSVFVDLYKKQNLKNVFFIGKENNTSLMQEEHNDSMMINDIGGVRTNKTENADSLLILGPFDSERDSHISQYLHDLRQRGIIAYCPNPDLVVHNNGVALKCAGAVAKEYENLGGTVIWCGKPYYEIYEYAMKKFNVIKDDIIAIGDSLLTDIAGANNFGIKSILTLTGITKSEDVLNIKPTFIIKNLFEIENFN